jgi:6-phosphogluconolactonase
MSQESRLVFADGDALARGAGVELMRVGKQCVAERGVFTLALSGGSTPKKLYALLATDAAFQDFPWAQTHFFFGDERHVPPDHPDSNYRMVRETLLSTGLVPDANMHRVMAESPNAEAAAAEYEVDLKEFFREDRRLGDFPRFDVVLLGMGPDGHTASLFPGSPGLEETQRWVIANWVEKFNTHRITFTFPVLDAARFVYLLVGGKDKAEMLEEVLVTKSHVPPYPVQTVAPVEGEKIWLLDEPAAARLPQDFLTR